MRIGCCSASCRLLCGMIFTGLQSKTLFSIFKILPNGMLIGGTCAFQQSYQPFADASEYAFVFTAGSMLCETKVQSFPIIVNIALACLHMRMPYPALEVHILVASPLCRFYTV
ncbi:hypothetical protein F4859DRAFT_481266 [Xylaria cf. heliscus]|nr:hypothetical protein F4859DRAFT_481266 [Xylaria cf. heliscus]